MIHKDNRQEEAWPARNILDVVNITTATSTALGIPIEIAMREIAHVVLLSCGHYLVETNDAEQFKYKKNESIRCKPCYHIMVLRQSLLQVQNAISNERPGKAVS
jgi:hypothetical protein